MAFFSRKKKEKDKDALPFRKIVAYNFAALKLIREAVGLPALLIYHSNNVFWSVMHFLSNTWFIRYFLNRVQAGTATLSGCLLLLGGIAMTDFVCTTLYNLYFNFVWQKKRMALCKKVNLAVYRQASRVELACYEDPAFYDKHVKAMDEAANRMFALFDSVDDLVDLVCSLVLNGGLLLIMDPLLALFAIFPILFGLLRKKELAVYYKYVADGKPIDRRGRYIRRTFYQSDYAKEMRMTEMAPSQIQHFRELYGKYKKILRKYGLKRTVLGFLGECSGALISEVGSVFYAVFRTVVSGTMGVGDCAVTVSAVEQLNYYLNQSVTKLAQFSEHALYLRDFFEFLAYDPKIPENPDGEIAKPGVIAFEGVSFSYPGSDEKALDGLSFTLRPGERLALVGMNGAGKSTVVKLLLRLYLPTEGRITLNGKDLSVYSLASYRQLFATMFQDYRAFSLSVAENVTRRPLASDDDTLSAGDGTRADAVTPADVAQTERRQIENALALAGVKERVDVLPKGADTVLTKEFDPDGAVLSGGEGQKLQLAAVFFAAQYTGAPVAVLDEPSSALDPIAEYKVFQGMIAATEGKSVLFISHRLSSAVLADKILLLAGGRLAECGSHAELLQRDGQYAAMFRRQAENYFDSPDGFHKKDGKEAANHGENA